MDEELATIEEAYPEETAKAQEATNKALAGRAKMKQVKLWKVGLQGNRAKQ